MPLAPGTRLGPFEILAPIGAGGMGEVYRARDTKLGRDVAVKVLPPALAQDSERLARFEREAKVLALLNHPNIAQIYGIEDHALIMELVDGETLQGPLPLETALHYARQIAGALEAAHEKNIIHRHLKPANIMIAPGGVVKVLDFGLAAVAQSPDSSSSENSPTRTISPTRAGIILGTAAYMSPEQARGKPVDKRTDIWAFGVVLYEMLTGKRLFQGEDLTETLASVVKEEPNLEDAPLEVRRLLRKCLQKDPTKGLRDIGDAWELLEEPQGSKATAQRSRFRGAWWIVAAALTLALGALALARFREQPPAAELMRFEIPFPPNTSAPLEPLAQVSPDGRKLAFSAVGADGLAQLWIRSLDSLEARPVPGAILRETGATFIWSWDSRFIAFLSADSKLKKVVVSSGSTQTLCDLAKLLGGSWNRERSSGIGRLRICSRGA